MVDYRRQHEVDESIGFILIKDQTLAGAGCNWLAISVRSSVDARIVYSNAQKRAGCTDARFTTQLPDLGPADELTIVGRAYATAWYESGRINLSSGWHSKRPRETPPAKGSGE